jgi:hypothetical protein
MLGEFQPLSRALKEPNQMYFKSDGFVYVISEVQGHLQLQLWLDIMTESQSSFNIFHLKMNWWSFSNWQTTFIRSRIIWNFKSDLCISWKTWSRITCRGPPQRRAIQLHDFRLMCASDLSCQKFVDKWRWTTNPNNFVNSNTFKMSLDRLDFILEFKSES